MIKDKSIYDPVEEGDGHRVLVMRVVRDPSIFERHAYDVWMRSLGPATDSLRRWWDGTIDTPTFYAEYRRDVSRRALTRLRALERRHGVVTLLCRERRPEPCHRYELVRLYRALYPGGSVINGRHKHRLKGIGGDEVAEWRGPGGPFSVLFDGDGGGAGHDGGQARHALPAAVRESYGDWRLPAFRDRPYVYANFVISHDGRVSFGVPGAVGGGTVSGFNRHDQWLMGLLRARADAILVGDNTLRSEPEHLWTAEAIFPDDAAAFAALRRAEGRRALPLQVFVSFDGNIVPEARVFGLPDLRIVIATTRAGVERARAALGRYPNVDYLAMGEGTVDLGALARALHRDYGAATILCEGGPTLYGSLVRAGQLDDEFLTISPILIGNPRDGAPRPGLVEGVAFEPHAAPTSQLIGVRRAGDHLFLRSRYR